jgi:hypothetical protein
MGMGSVESHHAVRLDDVCREGGQSYGQTSRQVNIVKQRAADS